MGVSVLDKPMAKPETQGSGGISGADRKIAAKYQRVVGNEVEIAILRTMQTFRAEVLKRNVASN